MHNFAISFSKARLIMLLLSFHSAQDPPDPVIGCFSNTKWNGLDTLEADFSRSPGEIAQVVIMCYVLLPFGYPKLS